MRINSNDFQVFKQRHSFDSEDQQVLKNNFPKIVFEDIPDAWIILLDELLATIDNKKISRIAQMFGLLIVSSYNLSKSDQSKIAKTEKQLIEIDCDLLKTPTILN
jgi:hypothetical protein